MEEWGWKRKGEWDKSVENTQTVKACVRLYRDCQSGAELAFPAEETSPAGRDR